VCESDLDNGQQNSVAGKAIQNFYFSCSIWREMEEWNLAGTSFLQYQ